MKKRLFLSVFCLSIAVLACLTQPALSPPKGSSGNNAPLYGNAQKITVSQADQDAFVADVFGGDALLYSSVTDISWTKDTGDKVQGSLDNLLPNASWRVESDWANSGQSQRISTWRNGDLRLEILILDNADSNQLSDLNKRYGISGLEPGFTLIVSHMWDISKLLPSPTPTDTPIPSSTPLPTSTPVPTSTPIPTNTPIPPTASPDTSPGTLLKPGDVWYQGGMEMRLKSPTFLPGCNGFLGFELTIINNTGGELVTNISGLDFSVSDDHGQSFSDVWWDKGSATDNCYGNNLKELKIASMAAGGRLDLAFRVLGNPDQNASQYSITILQAGRIKNAVWVIDVPR